MKKILTLSLILLSFVTIDSFAQNLYGGSAILYKEAKLEEANLEEAGGNQSAIMFRKQAIRCRCFTRSVMRGCNNVRDTIGVFGQK
jgi:hypothetical protein